MGLGVARFRRLASVRFVAVFVLWHVYFFGFLEGRGLFHDISHGLYLILFGHLVYLAARGLTDDLVEPRRKARMLLIAAFSLQLIFITGAELGMLAFADERRLDTINSGILLLITTLAATHLSSSTSRELLIERTALSGTGGVPRASKVPVEDSALHQALMDFMDSGGYRQTNLTIGQLAKALRTPEHRLRHLINGHLGFRNFSTFLGTYRIREACERLADASQRRIPILTIALELGYGSIGPFNRAFRQRVGQTPTEFRRNPSDPRQF
jgi:AraC-like DNA-binding protein